MDTSDPILPDDPRLTSYALGEMAAGERAQFEALLARDAAARAQVEEIRAAVGALGAALESEPLPVMTRDVVTPRAPATVVRFPQFYFAAAGLAAACFGIVFVMHEAESQRWRTKDERVINHRAELDARELPPPPMAAAAAPAPTAIAAVAPVEARRAMRNSFALAAGPASVPDRFFSTGEATSSSFPLRVGRDSLEVVREHLRRGVRPTRGLVHVAELINGFNYAWPEPAGDEPFVTLLEDTAAPWAPEHRLVRVGIRVVGESAALAALDATVRVDFDSRSVRAWRLIGFERDEPGLTVRGLEGEYLRGGDTVTALYEILPVGPAAASPEPWLTVALRYREPRGGSERVFTRQLQSDGGSFAQASADFKFIAALAAFGLALQDSSLQPAVLPEDVTAWALAGAGQDAGRQEFVDLMRRMPR